MEKSEGEWRREEESWCVVWEGVAAGAVVVVAVGDRHCHHTGINLQRCRESRNCHCYSQLIRVARTD